MLTAFPWKFPFLKINYPTKLWWMCMTLLCIGSHKEPFNFKGRGHRSYHKSYCRKNTRNRDTVLPIGKINMPRSNSHHWNFWLSFESSQLFVSDKKFDQLLNHMVNNIFPHVFPHLQMACFMLMPTNDMVGRITFYFSCESHTKHGSSGLEYFSNSTLPQSHPTFTRIMKSCQLCILEGNDISEDSLPCQILLRATNTSLPLTVLKVSNVTQVLIRRNALFQMQRNMPLIASLA